MNMNMRSESEMQKALEDFNQMSDYYDQYRPDYPDEIINTIIDTAGLTTGSKILEIGAGSGKATGPFAKCGFEMVCVEPGADLVKEGENKFQDNKNIQFILSRFEDYSEPTEYFDTIISAQAFHWISQPTGYEKCANALKKDGYLAVFWHLDLSRDVDLDRELLAILTKYDGFVACMPKKDYGERMESISSKIVSSGLFSKPEIIHVYTEKVFTADEYFRYMLTSNFAKQPDEAKKACLADLTQLAARYNGIKRRFTFELYLSQKL